MRENTLKQRLYAGKAAFGVMERGIKTITGAGRIAGCSCPDNLIPKFLGLGVQYFHSGVNRLLQQGSEAYLKTTRQAAADAGK